MAHPDPTNAQLGAFRLRSLIARGGMGEVWRGEHVGEGVPVAVKLIKSSTLNAAAIARFHAEVRAVARLDHRGIVTVLDQGELDGAPYLVMELAEATLRDHPPRSWAELRALLHALLDALAHAHAHDVIHRDIKPANVLANHVAGSLAFKLADFGLAHALDDGTPLDVKAISGTPRYMAPEQIESRWRDQGPWTDLYALGCVAYLLACGRPPYTGTPEDVFAAHVLKPIPALAPTMPVPRGFDAWVQRLLAKSPANRCRHASDARDELLALTLEGEAVRTHAAPATVGDVASISDLTFVDAVVEGRASAEPDPVRGHARVRGSIPTFEEALSLEGAAPRAALQGAGLGLYGLRPVPFVGRLGERRALWSALERACVERAPALVLLRGAAGTGKSRIAEWVMRAASELFGSETIRVTHGPIPGTMHGFPAAIAAALRSSSLASHEVLSRVHTWIAAHGGRAANDEAAALAELACPAEDPDRALVHFESEHQRHWVVRRFVERLAFERPCVVWVDDVQWGADALRSVDALAGARDLPALVVMTARDDSFAERERAVEVRGAVTIDVAPLSRADHAELVHCLIGLEGAVADHVAARTMGNPLFAVQLVGEWVQRGALEPTPQGFRVARDAQALVPDDIHALWSARIDRLLEDTTDRVAARRGLEVAAALGLHVDREEWRLACGRAGATASSEVVDAMVARRLAVDGEGRFSFAHEMLRESLERGARDAGHLADIHRACAATIEERHGRGRRGIAERLARHHIAAGDVDLGCAELLRAALERNDVSEFAAAQSLLAEREALLARLGVPEDDERWALGWRVAATSYADQGAVAAGEEVARKLAVYAASHGRLDLEGPAQLALAIQAHRKGAFDEGAEHAHRAFECARAVGADVLVASALLQLGQIYARRAQHSIGIAFLRESMAIADRVQHRLTAARARYALGSVLVGRGELEDGRALLEDALERMEKLGARVAVAMCHTVLGDAARGGGDLARAERHYEEALVLQRQADSKDALINEINVALVQLARGRRGELRGRLEALIGALREASYDAFEVFVHAALLPIVADARDFAAWDVHLGEVERQTASSSMAHEDIAWATALGAEVAAAAEEPARAARADALAAAQRRAMSKAITQLVGRSE